MVLPPPVPVQGRERGELREVPDGLHAARGGAGVTDERVKEYRVNMVCCEWESKGERCRAVAHETIRLWPDGGAGPFCYHHMRVYVGRLEERGYRRRTD